MNQAKVPFRLPARASRREQECWTQSMLCQLEDVIDQQNCAELETAAREFDLLRWATAWARADRPELLQDMYPEIAEFVVSPKRARGQAKLKVKPADAAEIGAEYARRIRAHWMMEHRQKKRRHYETSAEQFAVMILNKWGYPHVTVGEILTAAKRVGKRKARQT